MKPEEFVDHLKSVDYKLPLDENFSSIFEQYIDRGLQVLTFCYGGDVRSYVAAMLLTEKSVPSVCLHKGIVEVLRSKLWRLDDGETFLDIVRPCPNIAVILDTKDNATVYRPFTDRILKLSNAKMYESDLVVYSHFT